MEDILNRKIVGVGHSHLGALRRAYRMFYCAEGDPPLLQASFLRLHGEIFQPNIVKNDGVEALNEIIPRRFTAHIKNKDPDVIVSCIRGNEYSFLSLLNHPKRFDFYSPIRPDLAPDKGVEVLPFHLVVELMRARLEQFRLFISALSPLSRGRMIHVPPPPPIPDNKHIEAHPALFGEHVKQLGVSPAPFRLKMWLLNREIQQQICEDSGIVLYHLPATVFDSDGYLSRCFWSDDPTHGNADYGKVVLDDISMTRFVFHGAAEHAPV